MSKRLQVVMPDEEYRSAVRVAKKSNRSISELVRDSIRRTVQEGSTSPEARIAAVLKFAAFSGPTGDIDALLHDIEVGRNL
jgi:hypothetical protein